MKRVLAEAAGMVAESEVLAAEPRAAKAGMSAAETATAITAMRVGCADGVGRGERSESLSFQLVGKVCTTCAPGDQEKISFQPM